MIVMTVTEFARNMKEVLNRIEYKGEEVHLVRNRKRVIKLLPEAIGASAADVFGDLHGTLPETAATNWLSDSRMAGFRQEPRDPWLG